jgi:hypothetical protein
LEAEVLAEDPPVPVLVVPPELTVPPPELTVPPDEPGLPAEAPPEQVTETLGWQVKAPSPQSAST